MACYHLISKNVRHSKSWVTIWKIYYILLALRERKCLFIVSNLSHWQETNHLYTIKNKLSAACGVPQGSELDPTILYSFNLFANEMVLIYFSKNYGIIENSMLKDLKDIFSWMECDKLLICFENVSWISQFNHLRKKLHIVLAYFIKYDVLFY